MQQHQTLYVFKIKKSSIDGYFNYMGEPLYEVSAFGKNEQEAIDIISREFGVELIKRLEFDSKTKMKLFGKIPHRREVMIGVSKFQSGLD